MTDIVHLRGGTASFIIDVSGPAPVIAHWGARLDDEALDPSLLIGPVPHSSYDEAQRLELVPQASSGWRGRPALAGHRGGRGFSPRLVTVGHRGLGADGHEIVLADAEVAISLAVELHLTDEGMLRIRSRLTNDGPTDYQLQSLATELPVGQAAAEILDLTGRWCREQHPQRHAIAQGTWLRSGRHGRTGPDSSLLLAAGSAGFGNRHGRVWAAHLGFSGDHEVYLEKTPYGPAMLGMAELFGPGEITLAPGRATRHRGPTRRIPTAAWTGSPGCSTAGCGLGPVIRPRHGR